MLRAQIGIGLFVQYLQPDKQQERMFLYSQNFPLILPVGGICPVWGWRLALARYGPLFAALGTHVPLSQKTGVIVFVFCVSLTARAAQPARRVCYRPLPAVVFFVCLL
jgi:hypothetical protein